VVHAFDFVLIALMHHIDPQISRSAVWLRPTPLADIHLRRPSGLIAYTAFAVWPTLPQPIQLRHRQPRQAHILGIAKVMIGAL
jgi:hypothetical protein